MKKIEYCSYCKKRTLHEDETYTSLCCTVCGSTAMYDVNGMSILD